MIEPGESSNEALIETSRDVLEKLKGISRSIIPSTQVICPLKGLANDINSAIRQIFLGNGIEPESIYTTGEKVIQLSNDYKIGGGPVYNGEIGEITSVKHNEYTIKYVRTDNEHAIITYSEGKALRNISYGYCITIHKAQGSEYDNVIAVLPETRMLDLRLLYTAVTRARKKLIIISSEKAIAMAHENGFF